MKICVIGAGYVGLVVSAVFADWGEQVVCVEQDLQKVRQIESGKLPIYEPELEELVSRNRAEGRLRFFTEIREAVRERPDLVMIAVGTPSREDGELDLAALWSVLGELKACAGEYRDSAAPLQVAIKSTVPVGTCSQADQFLNGDGAARFDVIYSPEFLRQGAAVADLRSPDRMVVGCASDGSRALMERLYRPMKTPVVFTDWQSAEMIKVAANAYLATRLSFVNLLSQLCEQTGANIADVAYGMGLDHRIGSHYFKPGPGFGGSCLPKDTRAMVRLGERSGVDASLFQSVLDVNEGQKKFVADKVEQLLGTMQGKRIGVLGLAFKANTNDLRESTALEIVQLMSARGAEVEVYDPQVEADQLAAYPGIRLTDSVEAAAERADALVILTEWREYRAVQLKRLRELMANPLVVDTQNLLQAEACARAGLRYVPLGAAERLLDVAKT